MAKIRVVEEMTNEQLLKEFLRMRDELDTLSKKYDRLAKEHYDLKANYNDLKFQYDYLDAKYKQVIAAKYQTQRNTVVIDMPTLFDDLEEETLKLEQELNCTHKDGHESGGMNHSYGHGRNEEP